MTYVRLYGLCSGDLPDNDIQTVKVASHQCRECSWTYPHWLASCQEIWKRINGGSHTALSPDVFNGGQIQSMGMKSCVSGL